MKSNRIVVYTAISNGYDDLIDPKVVSPNCDYICFTDDNDLKSEVWNTISFPDGDYNSIEKNRYVKLLPHKFFEEYEYSIYIDGNINITGNLEELVEKYLSKSNYNLAIPKHPIRNCLYKEAKVCIKKNKGNPNSINKQIQRYRNSSFPQGFGLTENNIIFRKHNDPKVIKLMEDWWQEFSNNSKRDQLSLSYVIWKNNFDYLKLDINARNSNNYFEIRGHRKKGIKRIWQLIKMNKDKNFINKIFYNIANNFKKIINIFR